MRAFKTNIIHALHLMLLSSIVNATAPVILSSDEKMRYERGEALNKEVALYGLDTLRHYKARVVSIKPEASGSNGSDIELSTQTALVHESGKPWFYCKEQTTKARTLHWRWPDTRPVPVCVGFVVDAYADNKNRIQRISLNPGTSDMYIYLVALRRTIPNGPWEVCIATSGLNEKKTYLALQPDHLNVDYLFQVEWNVKHGLAVSNFRVTSSESGDGADETEGPGESWPGWPLANVFGAHVRPGRDGWERSRAGFSMTVWEALRLIPAAQYIGTSNVSNNTP